MYPAMFFVFRFASPHLYAEISEMRKKPVSTQPVFKVARKSNESFDVSRGAC